MPQVIEYPPVGADARAAVGALARVCKETSDGEPFRELRARLRAAGWWDRDRPLAALRVLGAGGKTITRSPFMVALAEAATEDVQLQLVGDRLFDLNPILWKVVLELVAQRPLPKGEIYKHLGSFAYPGKVPSRPDFDTWLALGVAVGALRQLGVAMMPGANVARWAQRAAALELDELVAEDRPEPEPELPAGDDAAAPEAPAAAADTAAVIAQVATGPGEALPPQLRHLAAAPLPSPRGERGERGAGGARPVPASRFAAGFSDELRAETAARIAAWWGQARVPSRAPAPADFGFDTEQWVENADELLYRVAVAAALAFRLDAETDGVVAAFKALDAAGVLADLYHGTVPTELPAQVDARALMLASLAARRCAEAPELAAALDGRATAADAFDTLDAALGRGLFRIELLWMLRTLGQLGVVRWDDLPAFTALPFRLVRDTLFRLGFLDTPYAADAPALLAAARAARAAVAPPAAPAGEGEGGGGAGAMAAPSDPPDEILAAFALAAGCAYDCPHKKTCGVACRERLEA